MQQFKIYLRRIGVMMGLFLIALSNVSAQKILAFDKSGRVKRIRYYEGDYIALKKLSGIRLNGTIDQIKDSAFVLEGNLITLDSVSKIYNTQKRVGFKLFGKIFIRAGAAYFPIVTANRLINNDNPTFSKQAAFISGAFLTAGIICHAIANRPHKISEKHPLKIIDISP